jgi:methylenetetrahydrofolate dehydrogenase (NADP+)/methenyltetrahydrofolate cyclohydrolase
MTATLLDGKAVAAQIRADLSDRVVAVENILGRPPCLAIVLVGEDPASHVYVRNKLRTAQESGMNIIHEALPDTASLEQVLDLVGRFNSDDSVDGILVQSPLPATMGSNAEQQVFDAIEPKKDVDGFSPISAGLLSQNRDGFAPCTPSGVVEMLDRLEISVAGKHAVVIGRSDIVGKPMSMLLLHRNATVTICHSRTADLPSMCKQADILVAAIGRPAMVTEQYVKPGAIVIDVGINRVTDPKIALAVLANWPKRLASFEKNGAVLIGDVHPDVIQVAGALTPVPGGVGPLTIAMLMVNTVRAAELRNR